MKRETAVRAAQWAAIVVSGVALAGTMAFLYAESTWVHVRTFTPEEAFHYAATGTEIMPMPVFVALPVLFPDQFQPGGREAGDWIDQFGFIRGKAGVNGGLPGGFFVSNHRPKSGAPSPVEFVGINCSLCHSSLVRRTESDPGVVVAGMGNTSLDFIAWVDAFKTAMLDEKRMTVDNVVGTYERVSGKSLGLAEKLMVRLWLTQTRKTIEESEVKTDSPYGGADLRDYRLMPNGPSRTQPFRNLVRNIMNRPALLERGLCKLPVLYRQKDREWGQFDGTVRNRLTRSVLAAIAVGATYQNLSTPEVSANVTKAIEYTMELKGPKFTALFPDQKLDGARTARGEQVYMAHCDSCHGHPDARGEWVKGSKDGVVMPYQEIGTDGERVTFRYYEELADYLYAWFPDKQPLRPKREDLRPGPMGRVRGYLVAPIPGAFSRAPFLHNGSVATMAELINLKPRRAVFYRGANLYDPVDVGLVVGDRGDARRYFRMDASERGNSNKGHDYPWAYQGKGWNQAELQDLLEYLKTI